MDSNLLRDGDPILLLDHRGRRYLKRLKAGHRMTIRGSVISCDDLIGQPEGIRTSRREAERFRVFRPTYAELVPQLSRPAEPVFAKDAGLALTRGDIRPGQTVIEVGIGAGAMSMALLRGVGPTGKLITYEVREDFAESAQATVARHHGPAENWEVRVRNAREGFDERNVDRLFVDVPDPETLLESFAEALRPGAVVTAYLPTVLQVKLLHDTIDEHAAFTDASTFEVLERTWHVSKRSIRPDQRMVGHTGFLTIFRKLPDEEPAED